MFHPKVVEYTFFQVYMAHSPDRLYDRPQKQASVNVRKLKSYQASFQPQHNEMKSTTRKNCKETQTHGRLSNML